MQLNKKNVYSGGKNYIYRADLSVERRVGVSSEGGHRVASERPVRAVRGGPGHVVVKGAAAAAVVRLGHLVVDRLGGLGRQE